MKITAEVELRANTVSFQVQQFEADVPDDASDEEIKNLLETEARSRMHDDGYGWHCEDVEEDTVQVGAASWWR